jgi:hypothetical protein
MIAALAIDQYAGKAGRRHSIARWNYFEKFGLFRRAINGQSGLARDARDLWSGGRAFMEKNCPICFGIGWVCENHPNRAWHDELGCQCGGDAMQVQYGRRVGR